MEQNELEAVCLLEFVLFALKLAQHFFILLVDDEGRNLESPRERSKLCRVSTLVPQLSDFDREKNLKVISYNTTCPSRSIPFFHIE
jgi:hypothetical protein